MKRKNLKWIALIILSVLVLSNPSEQTFLARVATDYGAMHGGMHGGLPMDQKQLHQIGSSKHSSYLVFSTYSYRFGNVGVNYWGMANFTFFINSFQVETEPPNEIKA